jgi:mannitol-1-phosphate 5-dehydrogenase
MKSVIIGAGKTGRGFIAPILLKNNHEIVFIDNNEQLVKQLKSNGSYRIKYYDSDRIDVISDYRIYTNTDTEVIQEIATADYIFTSVFSVHLKDLIPLFQQAIDYHSKSKKLNIICCENGVDVTKPLLDNHLYANVGQGIIFCTTTNITKSLDLISEIYPTIPVDNSKNQFKFHITDIVLTENFKSLIERKIYTYNYISAMIAYIGNYLGYSSYGDAANDSLIIKMIEDVIPDLTYVIAEEYSVSYDEQYMFTQRALTKFKNKNIVDTITRNANQARRKLKANERIIKPFLLMKKYKGNTDHFLVLMACTIKYAVDNEKDRVEDMIDMIDKEIQDSNFIDRLKDCYTYIEKNVNLQDIIKTMNL